MDEHIVFSELQRNYCTVQVLYSTLPAVNTFTVQSLTDVSIIDHTACVCCSLAEYVATGLIEVISPPASFYPDMASLKQTLGDPVERVRSGRTK